MSRSAQEPLENHVDGAAESIVLDPLFIAWMYNTIMVSSAVVVNQIKEYAYIRHIGRLGQPRTTHRSEPYQWTPEQLYNPVDITVIGGSALTIYDFALQSVKTRDQMRRVGEYIGRETSDIDMVWWPRTTELMLSSSPLITHLCEQMIEQCNLQFQQKMGRAPFGITNIVCRLGNVTPGVHHIVFNVTHHGVTQELCDLSIHDGTSSQRYDEVDLPVQGVHPMIEDPVYCGSSILVPIRHPVSVRVPELKKYIRQQLFSFVNQLRHTEGSTVIHSVLRPNRDKAYINLSRVMYLFHVLSHIRPRNSTVLKDLIGTMAQVKQIRQYIALWIQIKMAVLVERINSVAEKEEIQGRTLEITNRFLNMAGGSQTRRSKKNRRTAKRR